jgi:uncharacterized protein YkwD
MVQLKKLALAGASALSVAALMPIAAVADDGSPIGICLPAAPALPGVPSGCTPSTSPQSQSQQTSQAAGTQTASPQTAKAFSVTTAPDLARALAAEVNRARRARGLRPLTFSIRLTDAATAHARALAIAGQFTHAWPTNGKLFGTWIRGFYSPRGYRSWSAGENLLWASPGFTPRNAVQQWLDSPIHRRVMLTPSWRELGIGVASATAAPGAFGLRDVQVAAAEFGKRSR